MFLCASQRLFLILLSHTIAIMWLTFSLYNCISSVALNSIVAVLLANSCGSVNAARQTVLSKSPLSPSITEAQAKPATTLRIRHTFHARMPPSVASLSLDRRGFGDLFSQAENDVKGSTLSPPIDTSGVSAFSSGHVIKRRISTIRWGGGHTSNGLAQLPEEDLLIVPDVTDRDTIVSLAEMAYDAYIEPDKPEWHDVGDSWNTVR